MKVVGTGVHSLVLVNLVGGGGVGMFWLTSVSTLSSQFSMNPEVEGIGVVSCERRASSLLVIEVNSRCSMWRDSLERLCIVSRCGVS